MNSAVSSCNWQKPRQLYRALRGDSVKNNGRAGIDPRICQIGPPQIQWGAFISQGVWSELTAPEHRGSKLGLWAIEPYMTELHDAPSRLDRIQRIILTR